MAKKPGTNPKGEFAFFNVVYEDDSQRSKATALAQLRVGRKIGPRTRLTLDVFNLFDRQASDIDYYYASRLPGEVTAGVPDIHFHPVEPRSLRLSVTTSF